MAAIKPCECPVAATENGDRLGPPAAAYVPSCVARMAGMVVDTDTWLLMWLC